MVLIDPGADKEFYDVMSKAGDTYGHQYPDEFYSEEFDAAIAWLIEGQHKSDIGVLKRMLENKLK